MTDSSWSVLLGAIAGAADLVGGLLLVGRSPSPKLLRLFVALGAGFMLAAALLEMVPEAFRIGAYDPALLIVVGYCTVHLLEHSVFPHAHVDDVLPAPEVVSRRTGYSVLFGLASHTFFDGVAIGSGFALSHRFGWIIFLAVGLHKIPEGFTVASVMLASRHSRRKAVLSTLILALSTVAGVLVIAAVPSLVRVGLPLSAGVTLYVAASDLVPELNRHPGPASALAR